MTGDTLTAVLDQLARHAEQITALGARQDAGSAALAARVQALAVLAARLDAQVTALATHPDGHVPPGEQGCEPAPARRWWQLDGPDRDAAIGVLRGWVQEVYRPGYGRVAATLGACWEQHPLCLYALDILAELWSVLYLAAGRTPGILTAQAEYQARILPALAAQMAAETSRCSHSRSPR